MDDLWDESWEYTDINDANFGVVLQVQEHGGTYTTSYYLKATNFGFAIPEGNTINGIVVEILARNKQTGASEYTAAVDHIRITVYYTPVAEDTCTYSSGDFNVDCSDNCIMSSNVNADGILNLTGIGNFTIPNTYNVSATGLSKDNPNCYITLEKGGILEIR